MSLNMAALKRAQNASHTHYLISWTQQSGCIQNVFRTTIVEYVGILGRNVTGTALELPDRAKRGSRLLQITQMTYFYVIKYGKKTQIFLLSKQIVSDFFTDVLESFTVTWTYIREMCATTRFVILCLPICYIEKMWLKYAKP